jgi:outer membrane protein assembly factor BamA
MLKIKIENCWRIISLIVFFCLQFFCSTIDAQTISVNFNVLDSSELSTSKYFKKEQLKSSFELENLLRKKRIEWIDKGFFLVSFETKKQTDNQFVVSVELGRKFKKITVELEEKDRWQLRKFNVSLAKSNAKFTANEFSTLLKNSLNAFLDNGYPFIAISFENLEIVENEISLRLKFDRGMIFRWTEIHIKGDSSISVNAIENSIGIRKGDFFNESLLAQVDKRIEQLSFITKIKASELLFTEKGVELFLYLKSQKISSVQGAIGLQPNPITQTMVLTGDLQMKLANVFKKAESVDLSWRSIQPQTQSLNFKLVYPYLFKSPFGIDARFNLYKRDSTFLDLKSALGVVYTLKNGSQLKASYQLLASNLLFASASSSQFSNLATVRTNSYGISYTQRKLDYIPNPSKGRFLNVEAFIGSRTATKDSVSEKKNVARASIQFDNYFSLAKRHVLKLSAGFETYYAPQVFQNELYRFGGLNSLRGFNEDELFASTKLSYT